MDSKTYLETQVKAALRDRLKREALANAERDVAMAAEWLPVEEEAAKRRTRTAKRKRE